MIEGFWWRLFSEDWGWAFFFCFLGGCCCLGVVGGCKVLGGEEVCWVRKFTCAILGTAMAREWRTEVLDCCLPCWCLDRGVWDVASVFFFIR